VSIDFHAHLAREDPNAPFFMRDLFDVDGYLEKQSEAGIERTLLSYALEDEGEQADDVKGEHDFLAGLIEQHPDRFSALGALDPFGGPDWLAEAERTLELGFSGFCFPTSRGGKYLDSEQAKDAFALADERGGLVFLHPSAAPIEPERAGHRLVSAWVGRPYDTGICLSRMLLADTLSGYPNIRMVVAHSGGTTPMLLGRLEHIFAGMERMAGFSGGGPPGGGGGPPGGGPPGGKGPPGLAIPDEAKIEPAFGGRPLGERLDQVYLDTASYHPAPIAAAIAAVGIDRVVLGTDFPPAGDSPDAAIAVLDEAGLSDEDKEKILRGNGLALLAEVVQPA
jgi:predicted TIM-barrel fold metal-dependent hydrolase